MIAGSKSNWRFLRNVPKALKTLNERNGLLTLVIGSALSLLRQQTSGFSR